MSKIASTCIETLYGCTRIFTLWCFKIYFSNNFWQSATKLVSFERRVFLTGIEFFCNMDWVTTYIRIKTKSKHFLKWLVNSSRQTWLDSFQRGVFFSFKWYRFLPAFLKIVGVIGFSSLVVVSTPPPVRVGQAASLTVDSVPTPAPQTSGKRGPQLPPGPPKEIWVLV